MRECSVFWSRSSLRLACFVFLVSTVTPLYSEERNASHDPSPHTTRFVTVQANVRLEVLDWGASGPPIVLLPGGGDTAHVFDEFALRLTRRFHVYGITRRGFGASGYDVPENGADSLADDVMCVLDALNLKRPVIVGHSIAGQEMSSIANRHPTRLLGLVYLEAGYPYAFDDGTGPSMKDFQALSGPQPPPPGEADLTSFAALRRCYLRVLGFTFPEAELRHRWTAAPDGRPEKERDYPGYATLLTGMKQYADIRVPALFIFGSPHRQGRWVDNSSDPKVRAAANDYAAALSRLVGRQANAVERRVSSAQVVRLPNAHHYIYLSNETEVLSAIVVFRRADSANRTTGETLEG